jgi:hypothetical protein
MSTITSNLLSADELLSQQRVLSAHINAAIAVVATKLGCYRVLEVSIAGPQETYVSFEPSDQVATIAVLANQLVVGLAGWCRTEEERLTPYPSSSTMERALTMSKRIAELLDATPASLQNRAMTHVRQCRDECSRYVKQLKPAIDQVVTLLLQHDTLSGDTIREIVSPESASA